MVERRGKRKKIGGRIRIKANNKREQENQATCKRVALNRKEKVEKTTRTKWEEADWKRKRKQEREKSKE